MSEEFTPIYCYYHPDVETSLRCNQCGKPICPKDAVLTDTGYRCKECVRNQQKVFSTAEWYDYPLIFAVGLILAYICSRIVPYVGFFTIFLAPIAGIIIAEAARFVVRRRRSKVLFQLGTFAVLVGSLLFPLSVFLVSGFANLWFFIWAGVFAFTATSTVYYRLAGIRIR